MKLALIVEKFDPRGGGAERSTLEVARHLARRGHAVTILAARCAPEARKLEGVSIAYWTLRKFRSAWAMWRFTRWANRQVLGGGTSGGEGLDATVSFTTAMPGDLVEPWGGTVREALDRNIALRAGEPSRAWKRIRIGLAVKQQLLLRLERRTMRDPSVQTFVALSRYVSDQLQKHYAIPVERIRIVPNAVEMPPISAEERALYRRRVREGFHIAPDSVAYLFAAMNPRLKGCVPLLHAARVLSDQGLDFTILLAGRMGYAEQHLAATLGIRDKVRFIGTTERMVELYCATDVTVLPTFYDPSSRVVIESLLAGTPAISTAYNGASDFIKRADGRLCGRILDDPADHQALAAAMKELADPAESARCAAATEGLGPELSIERHVVRLEELLVEVAARKKAGEKAR